MMSPKSAMMAEKLGYTNVKIYHDGLPVWKKGKNALHSSVKALSAFNKKDIPYVLIDVRPSAETAKGVIPGAVSIPLAELDARRGDFPKSKKAPVIIYGSSEEEALQAFSTVRGWRYKGTSVLTGGTASWLKAGNTLAGEARAKISYVPKPRPGSIPVDAFQKIADGDTSKAIIIDVRGTDEAAKGKLKGALNIPLTELPDRLGEIPKDKEVIAQCSTGDRAEMAYNLLKEAGHKVRWLHAKILIDEDGSFELEPR